MREHLAEAVGAGRRFGDGARAFTALAHATCTIERGDRIAVVGPSGSGKSTLLHLLAGLDTPTAGMVRWPALGEIASLRPSSVTFVSQTPSLLAPLTVQENVAVPLLLLGEHIDTAKHSALSLLEALGLEALADKLPEEVSGGQAQRVALARSLIHAPRLLIADEPTGQLDHTTAMHLLDLLLTRLAPDAALVIATHDLDVAKRMATVWTMEHGVLTPTIA